MNDFCSLFSRMSSIFSSREMGSIGVVVTVVFCDSITVFGKVVPSKVFSAHAPPK